MMGYLYLSADAEVSKAESGRPWSDLLGKAISQADRLEGRSVRISISSETPTAQVRSRVAGSQDTDRGVGTDSPGRWHIEQDNKTPHVVAVGMTASAGRGGYFRVFRVLRAGRG